MHMACPSMTVTSSPFGPSFVALVLILEGRIAPGLPLRTDITSTWAVTVSPGNTGEVNLKS